MYFVIELSIVLPRELESTFMVQESLLITTLKYFTEIFQLWFKYNAPKASKKFLMGCNTFY